MGDTPTRVSETILGERGPAMTQAMREFSGRRLDAPASLGKPLYDPYKQDEQRRYDDEMRSYRVGPSNAAEFYDEEHRAEWDIR